MPQLEDARVAKRRIRVQVHFPLRTKLPVQKGYASVTDGADGLPENTTLNGSCQGPCIVPSVRPVVPRVGS